MVSPSEALASSSLSSCRARASISRTRASMAVLFSCSPAFSSTAGVEAASATGAETSWPGNPGEAAISANNSTRPVAEKARIELWILRFMVNVLLWVFVVLSRSCIKVDDGRGGGQRDRRGNVLAGQDGGGGEKREHRHEAGGGEVWHRVVELAVHGERPALVDRCCM